MACGGQVNSLIKNNKNITLIINNLVWEYTNFRFEHIIKFQNDICDDTLSVYPHRASLKNMPGHRGNRTYDLWNTSPMLCQLSYVVRSVRVSDISEQYLVPSLPM